MEDKPLFRVGAAGLDPRDSRLIEIVFKHSQYNKYEYQLTSSLEHGAVDILIVNSVEPEGLQALALIRSTGRTIPVIAAVPRGAPSSARHAISIDRLTLQLLPILNRVVELELLSPETRPMGVPGGAPAAAATSSAFAASPGSAYATPSFAAPAASFTAPAASFTAPAPSFTAPAARPVPAGAAGAGPGSQAGAASAAASVVKTPLQPSPTPASAPPPSNLLNFPLNAVEPPISQRLRVLVVDDSPTVRRQLTIAFDRMGIACEAVESAGKGIEKLWEQHFDLALVDVVMPGMDGYKLTREIKRNRHWRQLPVIILTSRSSPFDLARGALAGCDTYLTKPVPYRALEAAVIKQMRRSLAIDDLTGMMRTATQPVAPAPAAPAPTGVMARFFRR